MDLLSVRKRIAEVEARRLKMQQELDSYNKNNSLDNYGHQEDLRHEINLSLNAPERIRGQENYASANFDDFPPVPGPSRVGYGLEKFQKKDLFSDNHHIIQRYDAGDYYDNQEQGQEYNQEQRVFDDRRYQQVSEPDRFNDYQRSQVHRYDDHNMYDTRIENKSIEYNRKLGIYQEKEDKNDKGSDKPNVRRYDSFQNEKRIATQSYEGGFQENRQIKVNRYDQSSSNEKKNDQKNKYENLYENDNKSTAAKVRTTENRLDEVFERKNSSNSSVSRNKEDAKKSKSSDTKIKETIEKENPGVTVVEEIIVEEIVPPTKSPKITYNELREVIEKGKVLSNASLKKADSKSSKKTQSNQNTVDKRDTGKTDPKQNKDSNKSAEQDKPSKVNNDNDNDIEILDPEPGPSKTNAKNSIPTNKDSSKQNDEGKKGDENNDYITIYNDEQFSESDIEIVEDSTPIYTKKSVSNITGDLPPVKGKKKHKKAKIKKEDRRQMKKLEKRALEQKRNSSSAIGLFYLTFFITIATYLIEKN